jgi:hypothetical protein
MPCDNKWACYVLRKSGQLHRACRSHRALGPRLDGESAKCCLRWASQSAYFKFGPLATSLPVLTTSQAWAPWPRTRSKYTRTVERRPSSPCDRTHGARIWPLRWTLWGRARRLDSYPSTRTGFAASAVTERCRERLCSHCSGIFLIQLS